MNDVTRARLWLRRRLARAGQFFKFAQRALQDLAHPLDAPFARALSRHGAKRRLDQPFRRTSDLGRVRIESAAPVLPSPRAPPDLPDGLVPFLKFPPPLVGQPVDLFAL